MPASSHLRAKVAAHFGIGINPEDQNSVSTFYQEQLPLLPAESQEQVLLTLLSLEGMSDEELASIQIDPILLITPTGDASNSSDGHNQAHSHKEFEAANEQFKKIFQEFSIFQTSVTAEIKSLKQEVSRLQTEKSTEVGSIRRELEALQAEERAEVSSLRKELEVLQAEKRAEVSNLRKELATLQTEKRTEIMALKRELAALQAEKNAELKNLKQELILQQVNRNAEIELLNQRFNWLRENEISRSLLWHENNVNSLVSPYLHYHYEGYYRNTEAEYRLAHQLAKKAYELRQRIQDSELPYRSQPFVRHLSEALDTVKAKMLQSMPVDLSPVAIVLAGHLVLGTEHSQGSLSANSAIGTYRSIQNYWDSLLTYANRLPIDAFDEFIQEIKRRNVGIELLEQEVHNRLAMTCELHVTKASQQLLELVKKDGP